MRPPPRSFLRRLPQPCKKKQAQPQRQPWLAYGAALGKSDLEVRLEQEAGETLFPRTSASLLNRTKALQVKEFLSAPWNTLQVRFDCPPAKRPHLDDFNLHLWMSLADPTDRKTAKVLWRLYTKLHLTSPDFLRALSSKVWDILWRTQSLRTMAEPKVVAHLTQLAEHMQTAGHKATFEQRLVHIETLFGQGAREAALEKWDQGYQSGTQDSCRPDYLELGVRMHAVAGNVMRAQELLVDLFASHPTLNPRLILYVFDAHLQKSSNGTSHVKQAWALYLHLQHLLGDDMAVKDYERCYAAFLRYGHREHALAVFRDMMAADELRGPGGYKANASVLKGFNDLTAVLHGADQLNQIFLSGLSSLPKTHQNKFFYAKWIDRLVSAGDVDAAAQVLELMFERDVQPRARHLNTLIRGWIQTRDPSNLQKAETLALQMVVQRINLVQRRNSPAQHRVSERLKPRQKLFLRRTLPPATSETFASLRQICLQRGDEQTLASIQTWQIVHAELSTTTGALNTQLSFYLQRGHLREVWRTFKRDVLSRPSQKIKPANPDIGTFALLWEASHFKQRTFGRSSPYQPRSSHTSFPPPSIILRHTLTWLSTLSARNPSAHASTLAELSRSRIPNRIIATYTAWNDLTGALVALHVLRHNFRQPAPTQYATNLLARTLARLGFPSADIRSRTPARRRQLNTSAGLHYNLDKILRALHALLQRRFSASSSSAPSSQQNAETRRAGENVNKEKPEADDDPNRNNATILLNALSELTRAVLLRQGIPPAKIEARVGGLKRSLGVDPAMPTGDKTAWEVAKELGMV
ncbi:hypothetical protein BFW01_g4333 [Lasiodiplodia theobromae]|uniref:Pentatricopeptide repeat-containing protein n=1 Tax=Lasiodiplodia theobromae TaxID=45133 RepID=A0A5N5D0Y8_9PEZI|nr:hypothetical protein DBV05_g10008 [Lasiodiplodia theobromae]KAF9633439.1 hypothetical protein BFW01_g4333 [Lasiodiplodia theobromae]